MPAASEELLAVTGASHEPYRLLLRDVRERLKNTRRRMEALLEKQTPSDGAWYASAQPLRESLELIDRSLRARSEEHTSELQSLMRISYAVFCLKKKKKT